MRRLPVKKRVCEPSSLNPLHQSPPRLLRFRGGLDFDCMSTQGAKIGSMRVALISFGLTEWVTSKCTSRMTYGAMGGKVRLSLRLRFSLAFLYNINRYLYLLLAQTPPSNHHLRYTSAVIIVPPAINANTPTATATVSTPRCHLRRSRPPRQSAGSA